jgi:hypothetical protein
VQLLAPFQSESIGPPNGMLEPDGTFVGVVYPKHPAARAALDAVDGITVLPSHVSRGALQVKHIVALGKIAGGKHGVTARDDGYATALKLHDHFQTVAAEGSRCCAVLHPDF